MSEHGVPAILPFARDGKGDHREYAPTPEELMERATRAGATAATVAFGVMYCIDFGKGPRLWTRGDLQREEWRFQ
jgi:hypothetical protein